MKVIRSPSVKILLCDQVPVSHDQQAIDSVDAVLANAFYQRLQHRAVDALFGWGRSPPFAGGEIILRGLRNHTRTGLAAEARDQKKCQQADYGADGYSVPLRNAVHNQ